MKILPASIIVGLCFFLQSTTIAQVFEGWPEIGEFRQTASITINGDERAVVEHVKGDSTLSRVELAGPEVEFVAGPSRPIWISDVSCRVVDEIVLCRGDMVLLVEDGNKDPNARIASRVTVKNARVEIRTERI